MTTVAVGQKGCNGKGCSGIVLLIKGEQSCVIQIYEFNFKNDIILIIMI